MKAIGAINVKHKVFCSICGCRHQRNISIKVYKNTKEDIEKAKKEAFEKANKQYTCKICKSIKDSL